MPTTIHTRKNHRCKLSAKVEEEAEAGATAAAAAASAASATAAETTHNTLLHSKRRHHSIIGNSKNHLHDLKNNIFKEYVKWNHEIATIISTVGNIISTTKKGRLENKYFIDIA